MRRFRRAIIYAASVLVCGMVLRCISYPDSVMTCLAVAVAFVTADGMLRMCDKLLDPPPAIFGFLAPSLWRYGPRMREPRRSDQWKS